MYQPHGNSAINSWQWEFGDGAVSNIQNPTHVYSSGGLYTVTLTVLDENDLSTSKSIGVTTVYDTNPPSVTITTPFVGSV